MRNLIRLRNERGDTIVEVLIVLAVLSLAFSISYATANNGLRKSTTAQQHSNALSELDSQLELLRAAYSQNANIGILTAQQANQDFCFKDSANLSNVTYFLNQWKAPANGATDNFSNYNGCSTTIGGATYYYSIDYCTPASTNCNTSSTTDDYYDLRLRWQGLGTEGAQQEELTYKINPLSTADAPFTGGSGPIITPPPPPPVTSWFTNGWPTFFCYDKKDYPANTCLQDGSSIWSPTGGTYGYPDFQPYYIISNGLVADSNGYTLTINYSNKDLSNPDGTIINPPQAPYEYTGTVVFYNSDYTQTVTANFSLPTSSNGSAQTATIQLGGLNSPPPLIYLNWNNDYYTQYNGNYFSSDANLEINSLKLDAN